MDIFTQNLICSEWQIAIISSLISVTAPVASTSSSEWQIAIISSLIGTTIGFFLAIGLDAYKTRQEEKVFSKVIKEELLGNQKILCENLNSLKLELDESKNNQCLVNPLTKFKTSFFDLILIKVPKLSEDVKFMEKIRKNLFLTNEINETISSKESYKTFNTGKDNYYQVIQKFDQILHEQILKLEENLNETMQSYDVYIS